MSTSSLCWSKCVPDWNGLECARMAEVILILTLPLLNVLLWNLQSCWNHKLDYLFLLCITCLQIPFEF